jgi:hypothetical protein
MSARQWDKKRTATGNHSGTPPFPKEDHTMNHAKTAFLITIYRILVKGKKHYSNPSVNALIDLVAGRHGKSIKRRWAFQCLHDIEALGYINRQERFRKDPDGHWLQLPSLVSITLKGARKLFDLGVEGAARLCQDILRWVRGDDGRWPGPKKTRQDLDVKIHMEAPIKLGAIFSSIDLALNYV